MRWIKTIDKETGIAILTNGECSRATKPKVAILSTLHGDELEMALLLEKLIKSVNQNFRDGLLSVVLIPFINIDGIKKKTREEPLSGLDLNRCFDLKKPPKELAAVKAAVSSSSLVIDVHCFPNTRHAFTGLLFTDRNRMVVSRRNVALIKSLSPEIIWHLNFPAASKEKGGTLGEFLTTRGIPSIAIETPSPEFLKETDIEKIVRKITKVIKFRLSGASIVVNNHLHVFRRRVVFPKKEGVFIPEIKPLDLVQKGQKIGFILDLSLNKTKIVAPITGKVIFVRNVSFVETKTKLAGIGKEEIWKD